MCSERRNEYVYRKGADGSLFADLLRRLFCLWSGVKISVARERSDDAFATAFDPVGGVEQRRCLDGRSLVDDIVVIRI